MVDVKIEWQPIAIKQLVDHYSFLSEKNERAALLLYNTLIAAPNMLKVFPYAGQIEPLLTDLPVCYRYLLVIRRFKIIYTVRENIVDIHAVWDCRQNEDTLKQELGKYI
ncbi:hypothetical protein M2459_003306 [Parabacteroides sp. PF5-5]|uniref:type II toxin-antitoxin system RelE/ParE family toxin n=1 Tax=unclassified Parabacteroides TaxID=2649774 RepID=UPI0024737851|nr:MULTISPECIES: type II toxin-antitoxin system RelE/ParE family toxin [unclassified Parabacteroides]MDH6306581.1 hypothetical protein [Parabacteroides sp. PH5-39]MDH6317548.1 hypothetical protein [Parabacteroides sp. PF5-13]MDH6321292.1 hypothetical protein [Parabacteroides sp. PH5-13]MDH6325024.1 hypothetical protein [Parabacteroides sp. PH5-8]MDH6328733.1 hypothetical protein [Parabacteroides sp. PH5-41]